MLQINGLNEGLELFKTLGSEVRMNIVQLLAERGEMNLNEIAEALSLTNGALTSHIRKLNECGIIQITQEHSGRGNQKRCRLKETEILLNVRPASEAREYRIYETSLGVGDYQNYDMAAPCGLAAQNSMLGQQDDPRYFAIPQHNQAQMLWFSNGFIEYHLPNLLPKGQDISGISFSMEISSAFFGNPDNQQSKIGFSLNGKKLGSWYSVEEADSTMGIYTPLWWDQPVMRHGFLKMIVINQEGVYLDGLRISEQPISDWKLDENSELILRIEAETDENYKGGVALYGAGFGNYQQDIHIRIRYQDALQKGANQ